MAVADNAPERVFYNARIFTAEPDHPYNEAWWRTRQSIAQIEQGLGGQSNKRQSLAPLVPFECKEYALFQEFECRPPGFCCIDVLAQALLIFEPPI